MIIGKNSRIEIDSTDPKVEELVRHSFRAVQESVLGNTLLTEYKYLRSMLRAQKAKDNCDLSISYEGDRISFSLEKMRLNIAGWQTIYPTSNESYTIKTIEDMLSLYKIEGYNGVSGGMTQVLTQLSLLQVNNNIFKVELCDINQPQLIYNALQLARYDAMPEQFDLSAHIDFQGRRITSINEFGNLSVENGTKFTFHNEPFADLVKNAKPARQFLYSSNIYEIRLPLQHGAEPSNLLNNCWTRWGTEIEDILGFISLSKNIRDGSGYMASAPDTSASVIATKEKQDLSVYSYCDASMDHKGCLHQSQMLRK